MRIRVYFCLDKFYWILNFDHDKFGKFKINFVFNGGSTYNYIDVTIFKVKWVSGFKNKSIVFYKQKSHKL